MRWILLITGLLLLLPASALADSMVPPHSYKVVAPGGRYVFVMIAPVSAQADAAGWEEWFAAPIRELRRSYAQSGLYRNDGSTTPLWTVDWYAYHVEPASDGVHLVRLGDVAGSASAEAVTFFANGQPLRSYTVADLVDLPRLMPHSVSSIQWKAGEQLDDAAMSYTIRTNHGERTVFDVRTGAVVSSFRPLRWLAGLCILAVPVLGWGFRRMLRAV